MFHACLPAAPSSRGILVRGGTFCGFFSPATAHGPRYRCGARATGGSSGRGEWLDRDSGSILHAGCVGCLGGCGGSCRGPEAETVLGPPLFPPALSPQVELPAAPRAGPSSLRGGGVGGQGAGGHYGGAVHAVGRTVEGCWGCDRRQVSLPSFCPAPGNRASALPSTRRRQRHACAAESHWEWTVDPYRSLPWALSLSRAS